MRIKNKEIRQRRHRKEKVVKAAQRELRVQFANKPAAEKPAAAPKAKPVAKKPEAAAKPKKAPAKKQAEEAAQE